MSNIPQKTHQDDPYQALSVTSFFLPSGVVRQSRDMTRNCRRYVLAHNFSQSADSEKRRQGRQIFESMQRRGILAAAEQEFLILRAKQREQD